MKTKIRMLNNSQYSNEYKKGDEGYIDGYVFNGERPYVVIIIKESIFLCMTTELKVINKRSDV